MVDERVILLIESEQNVAQSTMDLLRSLGALNRVEHRTSEEDALVYLHEPDFARPCLVLFNPETADLSESPFLRVVKSSPELSSIPVVVLTECARMRMIADCYAQGVAGYLVKSADVAQTREKLGTLLKYWSLNRLPSKC